MSIVNRLLSPEDAGGSGATAQTTPTPPSGVAGTPGQPAPAAPSQPTQPQGVFVSSDDMARYRRAEEKARGSDQTYQALKELGYDKPDSAIADLREWRKISSDERSRSVLEALRNGSPAPAEATHDPNDPQSLMKMLDAVLDKREQEAQNRRRQSELQAAQEAEQRYFDSIAREGDFAEVLKGNFDEAWEGKHGEVAQANAFLIQSFVDVSRSRDASGRFLPASEAIVQQAVAKAKEAVKAIRAAAIMDASQDTSRSSYNQPPKTVTPGVRSEEPNDGRPRPVFDQDAIRASIAQRIAAG